MKVAKEARLKSHNCIAIILRKRPEIEIVKREFKKRGNSQPHIACS